MVSILEAIILGIVQGITEWLPVSSSGHLVIAGSILGIENSVFLDFVLHIGTLLAVVGYYRKDIIDICVHFLRRDFSSKPGRLGIYLIIATLPLVFVGILIKDYLDSLFSSVMIVAYGLIFTGVVLLLTRHRVGRKELDGKRSFFIGIAQLIAILPGVSRSGMTISMGLFQGLKPEEAARFSFLLSIPAILGATLLSFIASISVLEPWPVLVAGLISSFLCGILVLKFLLSIIKKDSFWLFSIYCILLGSLLIIINFK
jgi:undecaprenyl-diphosphatase